MCKPARTRAPGVWRKIRINDPAGRVLAGMAADVKLKREV